MTGTFKVKSNWNTKELKQLGDSLNMTIELGVVQYQRDTASVFLKDWLWNKASVFFTQSVKYTNGRANQQN